MPRSSSRVPQRDTLVQSLAMLAIADLHPHPRNDGQHPPDELAHLKQSLTEHGVYRNVVVAQDGTILAGHGVVEAARALGHTHIPAQRLPYGPDDPRALKVLVGDNHIARLRLQDDALLVTLLEELSRDDPLALLGTGFDAATLAALADAQGLGNGTRDAGRDVEPQIDRAEELREQWGVRVGDLWALGGHRVMCGDCTDKAVIERLMQGAKANMVFTDPPYNVGGHSVNFAGGVTRVHHTLQGASWDQAFDPATAWPVLEHILAPDCVVYICTSHWLVSAVWLWMAEWSDYYYYVVWCKPNPMPSLAKRHWTSATELIAYAVRGKHVANFPSEGHAFNWWNIVSPSHTTPHPTEKPVAIPGRAIEFSSHPGAIVYDGFLGSGTTLIACENLGRTCYGCEIDPGYVAVTLQRYFDLTGEQPQRLD